MPFYKEMIVSLRPHLRDRIISYGTTGLFSVGLPTYLGPLQEPNLVFGAHWYDPLNLLLGLGSDPSAMRRRLESMMEKAAEWNVSVFIGEYGVPTDNAESVEILAEQIDLLEDFLLGSTIWNYNPTDIDWNDEHTSLVYPVGGEKPHVSVFVRPYPARIAGTPSSFRFDASTGTFHLTFRADPQATGRTEIVIPERTYSAGFFVEIADGFWEWDGTRRRLLYEAPPDNELHTIRLLPVP
jgi:endoglycosylceramidase